MTIITTMTSLEKFQLQAMIDSRIPELYCPKHNTRKRLLHLVCVQHDCSDHTLLCQECQAESHSTHVVV